MILTLLTYLVMGYVKMHNTVPGSEVIIEWNGIKFSENNSKSSLCFQFVYFVFTAAVLFCHAIFSVSRAQTK